MFHPHFPPYDFSTDGDGGDLAAVQNLVQVWSRVKGQVSSLLKLDGDCKILHEQIVSTKKLTSIDPKLVISTGYQQRILNEKMGILGEMKEYFEKLMGDTKTVVGKIDFFAKEVGSWCIRKESAVKITRGMESMAAMLVKAAPCTASSALKLLCDLSEDEDIVHKYTLCKPYEDDSPSGSPMERIYIKHIQEGLLTQGLLESFVCFDLRVDTGAVWRLLYNSLDKFYASIERLKTSETCKDKCAHLGAKFALEKILKCKSDQISPAALREFANVYMKTAQRGCGDISEIDECLGAINKIVDEKVEDAEDNGYYTRREMYGYCREHNENKHKKPLTTSWFPDDVVESDEEEERKTKRQKHDSSE